jgi:GntR family transcriptional repressor for pyruvate dehydrogenase complex
MKAALKVVEKKRAYEDIVRQVLSLIEGGELERGDQLPPERELSEIFKVSRATVREAIHTLESMKLLQSRQGSGTYVLSARKVFDPSHGDRPL